MQFKISKEKGGVVYPGCAGYSSENKIDADRWDMWLRSQLEKGEIGDLLVKNLDEVWPNSYVVVREGFLGDIIRLTGVLKKFKELNPDLRLVVVTKYGYVFRNSAYVDKVVSFKDFSWRVPFVYLDNYPAINPQWHPLECYMALLFGDKNKFSLEEVRPILESNEEDLNGVNIKGSYVVVHAGVSPTDPIRTWDRKSWGGVVKGIVERGYKVVLVGSGRDYSFEGDNIINLVNKTGSIFQIREILKKSRCFLGFDSGINHIAHTTDVSIISIHTNTFYERVFVKRGEVQVIYPDLDCKGCLYKHVPKLCGLCYNEDCYVCLRSITPETVLSAFDRIKP